MARVKKKKFSIKKTIRFTLILIILITFILNIGNIKTFFLSKTTGYQKEAIQTFLETNTIDKIKKQPYSKTLENIINTSYYQEKYLDNYLNITYYDKSNFFENINILLDKGYQSNDINTIYQLLNDDSINILIQNDYIKDITNLISINYFKEENLERYLKYYQKEELDYETILTYVNIGLDNEYYTNVIEISDQEDLEIIVNKYHKLDNNYVPSDLENVSYGSGKLRKEARIAFDKMCASAKSENIILYGGSGYRSYSHQLNLYNNYVKRDGKTAADTYSARAGYSEHQTGLAMDILNGRWDYIDKTDKEYTWLINNSYKFGFVLRYPEGKENITGYIYEPWHYRYIGTELAEYLTKQNLTYEEYLAKK